MDDRDESLENLSESEIEDIESSLYIETCFFNLLARTEKLEVIPIPDETGMSMTESELELVRKECKKQNIKLLYRVSHSNYATIFDPESKLTGIIPDDNPRGFYC